MKDVELYQVEGAEIKREKSGNLIVGFYSQEITDTQLVSVNSINENFFLVFYRCEFFGCDLGKLENEKIINVSVFHSRFGDDEMRSISVLHGLQAIKIVDTSVSAKCIFDVKQINNDLKIFN